MPFYDASYQHRNSLAIASNTSWGARSVSYLEGKSTGMPHMTTIMVDSAEGDRCVLRSELHAAIAVIRHKLRDDAESEKPETPHIPGR